MQKETTKVLCNLALVPTRYQWKSLELKCTSRILRGLRLEQLSERRSVHVQRMQLTLGSLIMPKG